MKFIRKASVIFLVLLSITLVACGKSVEGTYKITNGPVKDVTVTLGKSTFSFSSGASGTYEVSGDNVIFTGMTFNGVMKIEGNHLVNEKWQFTKQ